jgi:hypothetical protein
MATLKSVDSAMCYEFPAALFAKRNDPKRPGRQSLICSM